MTNTEYPTAPRKTEKEILSEKSIEAIIPYIKRIGENIKRIVDLIGLWITLKNNEEFSSKTAIDEILRASVVFTHAALEDFLRTLAAKLYPEANEQTLNQIPLMSLDQPSGRAEKFSLGRLAQFKNKTVEEVITDSVLQYLEHSNFNTMRDVTTLLERLDLDISNTNSSFPKLEELMKRRHLIVHRADRAEPIGSDEQNVLEIEGSDVLEWLAAVLQFVEDVLPNAAKRHLLIQGYIKEENNTLKLIIPKLGLAK